jgi:hypothetical protein
MEGRMGLTIRFRAGPSSGRKITVKDDVDMVVFGRDRDRCHVVFPADETKVGREHFALKRVLGRYRLVLNADNLVLVNGRPGVDDQELEEIAEMQLGPGGPKLVVERWRESELTATLAQGRRPSRGTLVQEAHVAAHRSARFAGIAVVLVLAVAGALFFLLRRTGREVEDLTGRVAELGQQQAAVIEGAVRGVEDTIAGVEARVAVRLAELQPRMKGILERAARSVYLAVLRNAEGDEEGFGTAWVVGPDTLATNAHVAQLFTAMPAGSRFLVRETGLRAEGTTAPVREWEVAAVELHPGYEAFARLWGEFRPAYGSTLKNLQELTPAGAACDVALLRLRPGSDEPLVLADDEEMGRLGAGDLVGFVGYPMERMAIGGVNLKWPKPTTQIGHVTAVTDYFGVDTQDSAGRNVGHLVQHALPATGGASGSPILDEHGHVVAVMSAGNVVEAVLRVDPTGGAEKARLPLPAGVNFAQRADLVRELLDATAAARQEARTRGWRETMEASYTSGAEVQQRVSLDEIRARWEGNLAEEGRFRSVYSSEEMGPLDGVLPGEGGSVAVSLGPVSGPVMVVATTREGRITTLSVEEKASGQRHPGDGVPGWYQFAVFRTSATGELRIEVGGDRPGARFQVRAYQAKERPFSADEVHARMLADWYRVLRTRTGRAWTSTQVYSEAGQLAVSPDIQGAAAAVHAVAFARPGSYLVVAVAPGQEDIDLVVARVAGTAREVVGKDQMADHFPVVPLEIAQPTQMEIYVVASGTQFAGTRYDLRVYEARPE